MRYIKNGTPEIIMWSTVRLSVAGHPVLLIIQEFYLFLLLKGFTCNFLILFLGYFRNIFVRILLVDAYK